MTSPYHEHKIMLSYNTKKIIDYLFQHEFLRYCVSGGTAFIVDFSIFLLATRVFGVYYIYGNIIAFVIAAGVNYSINRMWTFKSASERIVGQFISFCIIGSVGLIMNTGILYLIVEYAQAYDVVAKITANAIVLIWNYSMNKHVTFKRI